MMRMGQAWNGFSRRNSKCKGPEVRTGLVCFRSSKKASVAGAE